MRPFLEGRLICLQQSLRHVTDNGRRALRFLFHFYLKDGNVIVSNAIDRVTYHIGNYNISIFEVEVEEKAKGSSSVTSDLTKALLQAYQPSLQKWSHGKFVTGLAIQRLLETEPADNLLGQDRLKPEALGTIDRALRSTRKSWGQRLVRTLLSHR